MQLIPSPPKQVAEGFPPLRALSDDLLRANVLYGQTLEALEAAGGHSKFCLACGSRPPAFVVPVYYEEKHFAWALPFPVCQACTKTPPVVPLSLTNKISQSLIRFGSVALILLLLPLLLKYLPDLPRQLQLIGIIGLLGLAVVMFKILKPLPVPIETRLESLKLMLKKSPHLRLLPEAYPEAKSGLSVDQRGCLTELIPWEKNTEQEFLQNHFLPFDRGFVMADLHNLERKDGSLTLCTEVFRYITEQFHQIVAKEGDRPIACQALITFLPDRKRVVQTSTVPADTPSLRLKLNTALSKMPDLPVRLPVVLLFRTSNFGGYAAASEMTIPPPASEFQRYIQALTESSGDDNQGTTSEGKTRPELELKSDREYLDTQSNLETNAITPEDFARWIALHPDVLDLRSGLADFYAEKGDVTQAIEVWEKYLGTHEETRSSLGLYASFLERHERLEKAASVCQSITRRPDALPDDFAYLAHLQLALGYPEEAAKIIKQAPDGPLTADYYFSSARIANALNHPEECFTNLEKALHVDATYSNALLLRSNLHLADKRFEKAIEDIDRYLAIEGPSYRAYQIKAAALSKSRGNEAAIQFLTERIAELGNHPLLNGLRSEAYRESGKYELAIDDCNWILEHFPDFHPARLQRAELKIDTDDPAGAIEDAKYIVDAGGDDSLLYATLGFAYHLDHQTDQAIEYLQRSVGSDPRNISARYRLSQVYTSVGQIEESIEQLTAILDIDASQIIPLVVRGYQLLMQSRRDEAEKDFQAALELEPNEVQALRGMAIVNELRGDHKDALQFLDKALAIDPENEECLLDRSRLSMSDYNLKAAEKDLDQVIASSPNLLPALFSRAQLHIQLGRMEEALSDLDAILKDNPNFAPALIGRSAIHEIQGNDEKSQEDLDAAVELEPESADETELQRALIASQIALVQNRFDEAIEAATQAIELNPTNEQAYLRRASAYWYSDQFAEAWEDYNYVLETLDADSIRARNGRGGCAAELGECETAIQDLEGAVRDARSGDSQLLPYCLNNLARALIGNEQLSEAEDALAESLELQPRNAWLYFNRGLLRIAQKNSLSALEDFKRAVSATEPRLPPRKLAKAQAFIERTTKELNS
jgi:tetratricopeptide (TPR) repeat protein